MKKLRLEVAEILIMNFLSPMVLKKYLTCNYLRLYLSKNIWGDHVKLYDVDYRAMSKEDIEIYSKILENEKRKKDGKTLIGRVNKYSEYPKSARHYISLFPNNLLDIVELANTEELKIKSSEFLKLLSQDKITEQIILNHIRDTKSYFIIGSILEENYNFGHHDTFVFPEFMLGTSWKVDYLIIGRSSGGYEFVFVELEDPKKNITIKCGELGGSFRKGIKQVHDWECWLDSNFTSLKEQFTKDKHPNQLLPECFINYDKSRIHYVVVAGRREDFDENTYRIKRRHKDNEKLCILHYDNLYDSALNIIGKATY